MYKNIRYFNQNIRKYNNVLLTIPPDEVTKIKLKLLPLISIPNDELFTYSPPPLLTCDIDWKELPFTSNIYTAPTYTTPPNVCVELPPIIPESDSFAKN
jgi:hypothetical protein